MKQKNILIAEDDPFQQLVFKDLFQSQNISSIVVENGQQALEAYKISQNYDYIIMTKIMPIMDGCEATREIRKYEQINKLIPIMIYGCSADTDDYSIKEFFQSGINEFYPKPLTISIIKQLHSYSNK